MDVWEGGQEGMAKALQESVRKVPTDSLTALLSRDCGLHSVFCAQRWESKQAKESNSASLPSQDNKASFPWRAWQGRAGQEPRTFHCQSEETAESAACLT